MRDLQRRLGTAGYYPVGAEVGYFCASTESAVRSFQASRGLSPTGCCDEATWAAVVESSWTLGDRLLTLTAPSMRGDDVGALQIALAHLGFDPGKVDGIFGVNTERALRRFQRDCGLSGDGVCGRDTVRTLVRLSQQSGSGPGVAVVRERESLISNKRSLLDCRVVIGQFGGLSAVARLASRQLRSAGAMVVPVDEPDASTHAQTANRFLADVYLGLDARSLGGAEINFYAVPSFESVAGRALAERLGASLRTRGIADRVALVGRRLPVLRETRMPAVLCTIGPARWVSEQAPSLAGALVDSVCGWIHSQL